jgi:predicted MFS family arabinose efflux permease
MEILTLQEVPYTTRLEEVVWGIGLIAISLLIHGLGMLATLHLSNRFKDRFSAPDSFVVGMASVILCSWLIMLVHIAEIMMWAGFFHWKDCFKSYSTAVYFSGLQYTTVGSSLNLPKEWRLLEIMTASAGLLGFAWSTGVLMTLAQEFQERQLRRLRERTRKPRA